MIGDIKGRVGFEIHPDKTKILNNQGSNKRMEVTIDNIKVEVFYQRGSVQSISDKQ